MNKATAIAVLTATVTGLTANVAYSVPVSFDAAFAFLDNDGPNSIGITDGENITVLVGNVDPLIGTVISARQDSTTLQLDSLFNRSRGSLSNSFAGEVGIGSGLTDEWDIRATNVLGANTPTVQVKTNSLAGVTALGRPTNVQINSPTDTGTLSPTITWTNPAGSFTRNVIEIWNDKTDSLVQSRFCSGGVDTCTSVTIPEGMLAPDGEYSFRILAEDRANPDNFFTTIRRSNTFINHVATATDREAGDVRVFGPGGVETADTINSGTNLLTNDRRVDIGGASGPGALTLDSATSLTTTFVAVGRNFGQRGHLLVDGGTMHLDGSNAFSSGAGNGGLMNVGRSGIGHVDIVNGATVTMESDGFNSPGFQLGRNAGSFGDMNVSGSTTTITIDGSANASTNPAEIGFIRVGRAGRGVLNILDGAVVSNDPNGNTAVGESLGGVGGVGAIVIDGAGSTLNAGVELNIGDQFGNGGQGRLSVQNGGVVNADQVNVQQGGVLAGNGTVNGNVSVFAGGAMSPGLSPGLLIIDGDLFFDGGIMLLEANSLTEIDQIQVTGNATFTGGAIEVLLGFEPEPTDVLQFFDIAGDTTVSPDLQIDVFALTGSGVGAGTPIAIQIGDEDPVIVESQAAPVPEPGMFGLLGLSLAGLVLVRRRRAG